MKKFWEQIARYLYLRKKNADDTMNPDTNTRLMHGMNRISILLFLVAVLIIIFRAIFRH